MLRSLVIHYAACVQSIDESSLALSLTQMTSVERVFEYTELPPEAALDSDERHRPPHWKRPISAMA